MDSWSIINAIGELGLTGTVGWYLFETRRHHKLLRSKYGLEDALVVIPDLVVPDSLSSDKTMALDKGNGCRVSLSNLNKYEIYNVWLLYAGIYGEGMFFDMSRSHYEFIDKESSKDFPVEICLQSSPLETSVPTANDILRFKKRLKNTFLKPFLDERIVPSNIKNSVIDRLVNSLDAGKDLSSRAVIAVIFYDRMNNLHLTTRIYKLRYNDQKRSLTWTYGIPPKTEMIRSNGGIGLGLRR